MSKSPPWTLGAYLALAVAAGASWGQARPAGRSPGSLPAWLEEVSRHERPLATLVDRNRGLVVIHHETDSGNESFNGVISAARLCGGKLRRALPALQREIAASIARAISTAGAARCREERGLHICEIGEYNEYARRTYLILSRSPKARPVLHAVVYLDGGLIDDGFRARQDRYAAKHLARLSRGDCSGKPMPGGPSYRRLRLSGRRER